MPYASRAQQRKFHALLREWKIDASIVKEFDDASKGMELPQRVTKKADEEQQEQPSFLRRHAGPLVGLAATAVAAPLLYRHLRKQRLSADPALRAIQEQSGGKFTRVIEGRGAERGPVGKFVDKLVYGGGGDVRYNRDLYDKMRSGGAARIPGAVMHNLPGEQFARGNVDLIANPASDAVSSAFDYGNKMREYELFNHFAPGSMAKSESVSNVLSELGHDLGHRDPSRHAKQVEAFRRHMSDNSARRRDMLEGLEGKLREKYPKGYLLKDVDASATGGKFPSDAHNLRELATGDGPAAQTMVNAVKDPRSVMVQEKLPLAQGTWLDRQFAKIRGLPATKEVRVHVMNGAVVPELTTARFSPTMHVLDRDKLHGANDYARDLMSKLPEGLREGTYAMDVAPLVGGGYKLVESNPGYRSGFLSAGNNPLIGVQSHKAFTGRHSQAVAGLGAGIGAGAIGLGAKGVANKLTQPAGPEPVAPKAAP